MALEYKTQEKVIMNQYILTIIIIIVIILFIEVLTVTS